MRDTVTRKHTCAQRLSASQRSAPVALLGPTLHLECSTPFGITEVGTRNPPPMPLLATCAQRLSASQRSALGPAGGSFAWPAVLNAFRHHRGRHTVTNAGFPTAMTCSTPFGITEVGTLLPPPKAWDAAGAQRLSASQRSAPAKSGLQFQAAACAQRLSASQRSAQADERSRVGLGGVLNAFRHHRGRHPIGVGLGWLSLTGAQRLSASQRSAPGRRRRNEWRIHSAQRLSASQRSAR